MCRDTHVDVGSVVGSAEGRDQWVLPRVATWRLTNQNRSRQRPLIANGRREGFVNGRSQRPVSTSFSGGLRLNTTFTMSPLSPPPAHHNSCLGSWRRGEISLLSLIGIPNVKCAATDGTRKNMSTVALRKLNASTICACAHAAGWRTERYMTR